MTLILRRISKFTKGAPATGTRHSPCRCSMNSCAESCRVTNGSREGFASESLWAQSSANIDTALIAQAESAGLALTDQPRRLPGASLGLKDHLDDDLDDGENAQ